MDIPKCIEIENLLFAGKYPWSVWNFFMETKSSNRLYIAARNNNILVGYAGILRFNKIISYNYKIQTVIVDPLFQGQGIGKYLLRAILNFSFSNETFLEVSINNYFAISFYEKNGFVKTCLHKSYYKNTKTIKYIMKFVT